VTLTHHGQSVFLLTIYKTSSHSKSFPKWHSLYHQVPNSVTFPVLLNEYKITCSSLVSYLTQNSIIQLTFICQISNFFIFSHKFVFNIRMYRAICIISCKTKDLYIIFIFLLLHIQISLYIIFIPFLLILYFKHSLAFKFNK